MSMAQLHCPTCGADLGGSSICPRCGTLAGAELALAKFRTRAHLFFESRRMLLPRVTPHHFLWACALMPLFILPPLASLVLAVAGIRKSGASTPSAYEWIAIISALNLVVSGLILYKFHFSPAELIAALGYLLKTILRAIFDFIPSPIPTTPTPRVIPI